ncbi:MAG: carbamoyltransferase [Desulfomonile tiedjei]|nr:carbamoyltransferase [Desulfomonile tiedjei]
MKSGHFVVLGLYEVHMASAMVMVDGEVIAATHEERFSRLKNDAGFPCQAARFCLEQAGIAPHEVDAVTFINESFPPASVANILFKRPALFGPKDWVEENERYWKPRLLERRDPGPYFRIMGGWDRVPDGHYYDLKRLDMDAEPGTVSETFNALRRDAVQRLLGVPGERVHFMPHYMCHHYHAYYSGPLRGKDVVVIHAEGEGGRYNSAVSRPTSEGLTVIAGTDECDLGRLYQWTTLLLGMKPYHHEYKLMGLAPHASAHEVRRSLEVFAPIFRLDEEQMVIRYNERPPDLYFFFRDRLQGHRFDGIAGALQQMLEERLMEWVSLVVRRTNASRVCYGGGVAMNVKANMRLSQLEDVKELFVPLSPGDESNVFGAAYWLTERHFLARGRDPETIPSLPHAYLGEEHGEDAVRETARTARERGFHVEESVDAKLVARLLAHGVVAARSHGRGEFGQRALGNRSILANPSLAGVVETINRQIKYRDFWMPFAPTILHECRHDYLDNPKDVDARFMTVCFPTKSKRAREIAQALHPADGTARPQVLTRDVNPGYHDLIQEFQRLTGIGAVLNTSFNLHGQPIVNSPADALYTFINSELDALWLDGVLISRQPIQQYLDPDRSRQ